MRGNPRRRRQWSRRRKDTRCYVRPLDARHGVAFAATVDDVGFGGMFVATDSPPPPESELQIDVLPQISAPLTVSAKVVHRSERGFGCTFTEVQPRAGQALRLWLKAAPDDLTPPDLPWAR